MGILYDEFKINPHRFSVCVGTVGLLKKRKAVIVVDFEKYHLNKILATYYSLPANPESQTTLN